MKKFLLSLAALALAGTSAMAAPAEIFTVSFGSAGNLSAKGNSAYSGTTLTYTGKAETLVADKTWTVTNFNNNKNGWSEYIKCGSKNAAYTGSVATDFAFAEKITSVEIGFYKINEAAVTSIDLYTSADGETWSTNPVASDKNITTATTTVTLTDPNPAANQYYKIDFVCAKAKNNGPVWLSSIKYNGEAALSGDQKPADLSFGVIASVVAMDQIDTFKAPELNNPNNLPVTWTSSDEAVATVDANGKVTIKAEGVTTITATSEATEEFGAGKASYNLVVRRAGIIFDNPCTTEDCGFKSEIVNGTIDPWKIDTTYGLTANGYVDGVKNDTDAIMYVALTGSQKIPEGNVAVLNFQQSLNYFSEYTPEYLNQHIYIVAGKIVDGVVSSYETVGEITVDENFKKNTFYANEEIKLPASLSGEIFIGFRYTSTAADCGRWQIKNVMINYEPAPTVPAEITAIEAISVGGTGNLPATYEEAEGCWMLMGTVMTESDNVKEFEIQVAVAEGAELWYYAMSDESGVEPLAEGEVESELPPLTQSLDGKITLTSGQGGVIIYTKRNGVLSEPAMLQYAVEIEQKPSGIQTIENENETVVYDLFGRRINSTKALKGLYIVNGKKTIIR